MGCLHCPGLFVLSWIVCTVLVVCTLLVGCTLLAPTTSSPLHKIFRNPKAEERSSLSKTCQRGNHRERTSRDPTALQPHRSPPAHLLIYSLHEFRLLLFLPGYHRHNRGSAVWVAGCSLCNLSTWPNILGPKALFATESTLH